MKKSIILAVVFVLAIFGLSFAPFKTEANIIGEGFNIGARLEVSRDNGTTWYNYSADANPGSQTLTANAGDILIFRGKVWNAGQNTPVNLILSGLIDHAEYFDMTGAFYNDDEDENGVHYTGTIGSTTIGLPQILTAGGGENSYYEGGTFQATLKRDVPDQAVITATFRVDDLGAISYNNSGINPVPKALAQRFTGTAISTVRILVNNAPLPTTGAEL